MCVASIKLKNALHGIVGLHIDWQRLGADKPRDALTAWGSGERTRVLIDAVRVEMADDAREVKRTGLGESSWLRDGIKVSKDGVE